MPKSKAEIKKNVMSILLDEEPAAVNTDTATMTAAPESLPIGNLVPFAAHPFKLYTGERLDDMVRSIKELGVIVPVVVRPIGGDEGTYEILSGHNRVNAAKSAGLTEVPVVIKTGLTDEEAALIVTETNLVQRSFAAPRGDDFMAGSDLWGDINTLFEIGIEILRLMEQEKKTSGHSKDVTTEKIADGVLLMTNDKEILIAVNKDAANQLSDTARDMGTEKGGYLCYSGAMTAIPLYELSRTNAGVRDYIISEESLRATLCGNYPEYVKSYNMTAPLEHRITDADAPPYLFLQKQLDNEADSTRSEVNAFQEAHNQENPFERSRFDDVLELER